MQFDYSKWRLGTWGVGFEMCPEYQGTQHRHILVVVSSQVNGAAAIV